MSIEKYAVAYNYGFGFGKYNFDDHVDEFVDECEIHCKNDNWHPAYFKTGMKKITLPERNGKGFMEEREKPLYIVLENGVWKEYFTGTPVKTYISTPSNRLDIDCQNLGDIDKVKNSGIREFVVIDGSFSQNRYYIFRVLDPKDFKFYISKYSDTEIKCMVSQFYELRDIADKWVPQYEKLIDDIVQDWKNRTAIATASIEKQMGSYARTYDSAIHQRLIEELYASGTSQQIDSKYKTDDPSENGDSTLTNLDPCSIIVQVVAIILVICLLGTFLHELF